MPHRAKPRTPARLTPTNPAPHRRARALLEALESRVLLTAAQLDQPYFIIDHTNTTAASSATPALFDGTAGLTPAIIRAAYGIDQTSFGSTLGDGSGQTIAIVDAYNAPTLVSDLHAFDTLYGLPDPTLTRINEHGGTTLPGNDPAGAGNSWAVETSLDVEWAHAVAPKAAILLVEATSDSNADLMAAVNAAKTHAGVSVVSMSWGGDESSSDPSSNSGFTTPAGHNGVTFLAATGDSGAYGFNGFTKTVGYPAASPNVVAVGGTTLTTDSAGDYLSETAWGSGSRSASNGGSGGGISHYEAQPSYQNGVVTQSSSFRALPDVSLDADPNSGVAVIDSYDFGDTTPQVIGGTSLATPMWAGIIALADQGRVLSGLTTLDGATQTLPKLYALPASDFHDITTGNNGYAAGPGFDLATGRGTPIVNQVVADLDRNSAPTPSPLFSSFKTSVAAVVAGKAVKLTATASESGTTITSVQFYRESDGTAGLQVGSDTLLGTGIKSGNTWTLSTTTTGLTSGAYTYYAVATDAANVTGSTQTTLTILAPTIGTFTMNPATIPGGTASVKITAGAVAETGGTISSVQFYLAADPGNLQPGTDTLVGAGKHVAGTRNWTITADTSALAAGTYTYYAVATDGAGNSSIATGTLTVQAPAQSNDNFANAISLNGTSSTTTASNVNATRETGEPILANNAGGASLWWSWTAPSTGTVTVDTHGSDFDTLLGVYTGTSVKALTLVASDDDTSFRDLTSTVTFHAVAGTTYRIVVDGYNGATGNIVLNLNEALPVANDSFANAKEITGSSATWNGNNFNATKETGEPSLTGNPGGSSVWLVWTAQTSGTVVMSTEGSDFDTMLGVYTGSAVNALTLVAANDDVSFNDLTSLLSFNAVAGTTYHIRIDGYYGAQGNISFSLQAS